MLRAVAVSLFVTISLLSASVLAADMPEGAREVGERAKAVPIGSSAFTPTLTNPQCTIKVAAPFANFDLIEFHVKTQGYVRYCAVKQPNGKILADIIFQVTNAKNADALYVCSKQVWLAADGTVLKTSLKDANAYAGYNNVFHDITYMSEAEFKSVTKWAWDFTCTGE